MNEKEHAERNSGSEHKFTLALHSDRLTGRESMRDPAQEVEQVRAHVFKRARGNYFQIEITANRNCVCVCVCVSNKEIGNERESERARERERERVCMYVYTCVLVCVCVFASIWTLF